jgi:hypothetical protein
MRCEPLVCGRRVRHANSLTRPRRAMQPRGPAMLFRRESRRHPTAMEVDRFRGYPDWQWRISSIPCAVTHNFPPNLSTSFAPGVSFSSQLAGGNGTYDRTDQASVALTRPADGGGISQPRTGNWSRLRKELAEDRRRSNAGWVRRSRYSINQNKIARPSRPASHSRKGAFFEEDEMIEPKGFSTMGGGPELRPSPRLREEGHAHPMRHAQSPAATPYPLTNVIGLSVFRNIS